jgi:hypothetical protein
MITVLDVVRLLKENRKVPQKELVTMIMEKFGVDRIKAMSSYRYAKKVYWLKVGSLSSVKTEKPIKNIETDIDEEDIVYIKKEYSSVDPSFDMSDRPVYLDNYSPTYFQKNKD